ncbi:PTS sugar transporter subunit IIA [Priestia megaterium]|uniref:PTS sugar transporter subunit IIA n=1 Tax=Priestia megaterium TaxID=1404 RepID=UPI0035E16363
MLIKLLSKNQRIMFEDKPITWVESIEKVSKPLLNESVIKESYVQKMIDNVNDLGPYIVIAPKIALAHARPEDGVNEMGLSLLITKETVKFSEKEEHNAQLIFSLAATDSVSHLSLLSDLAQIFSDQANINSLCELRTSEEVLQFISECLGVVE